MKKTILLTTALLFFITISYGQFGKPDPSFGINGWLKRHKFGLNGFSAAVDMEYETSFPYGFLWVDVPAGSYTFTAKATDDSGMVTTSAPVKVSVVPHSAPTVSPTNPANNEIFAGPATIQYPAATIFPSRCIATANAPSL